MQNGFGQLKYNDHHIWVFSANAPASQTVTRTNWVDKFFYGEEDSQADRNITAFETKYVDFIRDARSLPNNTDLDSDVVAPLISLIEMRSAFLRVEMSRIVERLVLGIQRKMRSPDYLTKSIENYLKSIPNRLDDELKNLGADEASLPAVKELLFRQLASLVKKNGADSLPVVDGFLGQFLNSVAKTMKEAHIESLQSSFGEIGRTKIHTNLKYKVVHHPDTCPLILPDTGVAFALKNGLRPFTNKDDQVEMTFLPVSSSCMIVGYKKSLALRSFETTNSIFVSCSFESFIARDRTEGNEKLRNKIGRSARLLQDSEINRMVSSVDI